MVASADRHGVPEPDHGTCRHEERRCGHCRPLRLHGIGRPRGVSLSRQPATLQRPRHAGGLHRADRLPPLSVRPDHPAADPSRSTSTTTWKLTSDTTGDAKIDANPQELFGVKGASVDLAWQVTTGRPDVVIAVLDSGIRWGEPQPDLVNKFYLNRAELPAPEGSTNAATRTTATATASSMSSDYLADGAHRRRTRGSRDQNGNGDDRPGRSDLRFSDGVDDDRNGYVDDISGWDFFEDDNDALDEVRYGHGTGESHDSERRGEQRISDVGACPNCMLLEVRVGDSLHHRRQQVRARGSVRGRQRRQRRAGGARRPQQRRLRQQAVDYAYDRGVVVMASAADEESAHNNYPANYSHTVEVNSVVKFFDEGGITQTPKSYLYLNGCTNYNGHIAVAVPSSSCSSEATGLSSGMAGLLYSAALQRHRPTARSRRTRAARTPLSAGRGEAALHSHGGRHQLRRPPGRRSAAAAELRHRRAAAGCDPDELPLPVDRRVRSVFRVRSHQCRRRGAARARRAHPAGGGDRVAAVARVSVAARRDDRRGRPRRGTTGAVVPVHRRGGSRRPAARQCIRRDLSVR